MIQKKMIGRLGNQLFQYATVRAYMVEHQLEDTLGFNFDLVGDGTDGFCDSLKEFQVMDYQTLDQLHYTWSQKIILFFLKAIEKILNCCSKKEKREFRFFQFEKWIQPFLNKFGIFWVMNGYIPFQEARYNRHNLIFHGFFESPNYFHSIRDLLLQELVPKGKMREEIQSFLKVLKEEETVCISIRRGDFVSNPQYRKIHFLCDESYFQQAIAKMNQLVPHVRYYVCSDDVAWCKEHMNFPENTLFESEGNQLIEKVQLMSSCNHFILSNSTFSWWVQYLSQEPQKIVIAPARWRNFDYTLGKRPNDIYESSWIVMKESNK